MRAKKQEAFDFAVEREEFHDGGVYQPTIYFTRG